MPRNRIRELRTVRAGSLKADPRNWRKHPKAQREALQAMLARVGWADAVIARETPDGLVLVDGHLRADLDADAEVPVLVVDLDEAEAGQVLATLDPLAAMAEANTEALSKLLQEVTVPIDLGDLFPNLPGLLPELPPAPDDVVEPVADPVTKRGDIWQLGRHRLMCGDATNAEDVALLMQDERAHLLATDPPYLVDYTGGRHPQSWHNRASTRDKHWDDYHDPEAATGFYLAFIRVAQACAVREDAGWYQWMASLRASEVYDAWREAGLLTHQVLVWAKARAVLTHSRYMWQHELAVYGWQRGHKPSTKPPANAATVWNINQQGDSDGTHPTQKPVELFRRCIEHQTLAGQLCYEPFAGSGSQLIAAEQLNRTCYAMEIDPGYVDAAVKRWEAYTGEKAELGQ